MAEFKETKGIKTLYQIKDEYAKEHGFKNYEVLLDEWQLYYINRSVNEIANRYAQEKNKELTEMLEWCEEYMRNCSQYATILKRIEELIKEATEL